MFNTYLLENAIKGIANMRVQRMKLSSDKHRTTKMKDLHENTFSDNRNITEHFKISTLVYTLLLDLIQELKI